MYVVCGLGEGVSWSDLGKCSLVLMSLLRSGGGCSRFLSEQNVDMYRDRTRDPRDEIRRN